MRPDRPQVWLGWDANEIRAYVVAEASLRHHCGHSADVHRVCRTGLWDLYRRPTSERPGHVLWDDISGAPMSTDHAIARFFVPFLMDYQGWALFADSDVLVRRDVRELFALADPRYAVQVVEHGPLRGEGVKKGHHVQMAYPRKNQSSVMLVNCGHPSNAALTLDVVNTWPGRDLHAFRWLRDDEIGPLPAAWNWLVGVSPPVADPALVHFTLGMPYLPGHGHDPYADEWYEVARLSGYRLPREAVPA
jgi:hypothetical protein